MCNFLFSIFLKSIGYREIQTTNLVVFSTRILIELCCICVFYRSFGLLTIVIYWYYANIFNKSTILTNLC